MKKAISTILTAVTLSACIVLPASVNQSSGKSTFINAIVAEAGVSTNYEPYYRIGHVTAGIAKMYEYNTKSRKFEPFPTALVAKGTPVQILGKKGDYYLVSYAYDGMWMRKDEIKVNTKKIVCRAIQPVNFTYEWNKDIGSTAGCIYLNYTLNTGTVLVLDPKGICVEYKGNQIFSYDGHRVSVKGQDFFFDIGGKLQIIDYV